MFLSVIDWVFLRGHACGYEIRRGNDEWSNLCHQLSVTKAITYTIRNNRIKRLGNPYNPLNHLPVTYWGEWSRFLRFDCVPTKKYKLCIKWKMCIWICFHNMISEGEQPYCIWKARPATSFVYCIWTAFLNKAAKQIVLHRQKYWRIKVP